MIKNKSALSEIDKPIYNYWQALYRSLYSSSLYVDVGKRWKGFGLGYLMLLLCLIMVPVTLQFIYNYNIFFEEQIVTPFKEMPLLYIQNGKVSFDKPMPYVIKNRSNEVVGIIDTTGKIKQIDARYPFLSVLITQNRLFYSPPPLRLYNAPALSGKSKVFIHQFSENVNQVFVGKTWLANAGLYHLKYVLNFLAYPTLVSVFLGMYLVCFLCFALMGQLMAWVFFRLSLTYKQACRLMMVSSTAHIILLWISLLCNYNFPGRGFLIIIILSIYFCYAVLSLKRSSISLVRV